MIDIGWNIEGLGKFTTGLGAVEKRLDSLRPMWEQFGKEFYGVEAKLFDAQPWAPLSPAYAEKKRELVGAKPILRFTDALFKSLTQQGAAGNVHRINDLDAEFGSSDFKAMLHFTGTSRMPARNPLAELDADRYSNIAGDYLEGLIRNAGFN